MVNHRPQPAITSDSPAPLNVSYIDDPVVAERAATEDYATHVVPRSWRSGKLSLTMVCWSLVSGMFWMYIGGLVASTVGTVQAVVGMVVSCAIFGAINYVLARFAIATGLTTALISRRIFGRSGALLAALLFAATTIYYTVFEGAIIAEALHEYFGGGSMKIWYLVVIVAAVPLVLGGVRVWLDKFNGYLFPIYLVGIVATLIWIGIEHGASLAIADPGLELGAPGWLWTTTVYMGIFILMLVTVDFARFGKVSDAKYHGLVTFGPVFYLLLILVNGLVGIFITASGVLGSAVSEGGIAAAIVGTMGIVGLLFIVVSQSRANTANLYLASTNTEMVFSKLLRIRQPRIVWTLVAAAIAYAIMLTDIFSYILRALNWQGVFVVGWVGIVLVHIFVHRHQSGFEFRAGRLKAVSPAVAVWVISAVVGITMIEAGGTTGATWAPPATFLVSAIGYALVSRWDAILHRPHDPQHEVDDVWDARIKCHVCDLSYVAVEMDRDPSADLQAICSECSDNSAAFLSAAKRESS